MPNNLPANSPVRIWLAEQTDIPPVGEFDGLFRFSDSESRRLDRIKHPRRKQEFVASRMLIRLALTDYFGEQPDLWQIEQQSDAPPLIANAPRRCYSSLAHSDGLICYSLADHPVGVDVEANDKPRDFLSLAESICNRHEVTQLKASTDIARDFCRMWCAKEACYKALPRRKQQQTSLGSLSFDDLSNGNSSFTLWEKQMPGFQLSAVSKAKRPHFSITKVSRFPVSPYALTMQARAAQ